MLRTLPKVGPKHLFFFSVSTRNRISQLTPLWLAGDVPQEQNFQNLGRYGHLDYVSNTTDFHVDFCKSKRHHGCGVCEVAISRPRVTAGSRRSSVMSMMVKCYASVAMVGVRCHTNCGWSSKCMGRIAYAHARSRKSSTGSTTVGLGLSTVSTVKYRRTWNKTMIYCRIINSNSMNHGPSIALGIIRRSVALRPLNVWASPRH